MTKDLIQFPQDFIWGAATSSYQIEGAWDQDQKGESIWDRFSHTPGKIENGETGDVACDHYHRYPEDVALMKGLGLQAYRFSVSWPRFLPAGRGQVSQAGVDFYSRLVDKLLEAGIEPFLTLYHWDMPQILEDQGGWPSRMIVDAFLEFTDVVTRSLGDRVKYWTTFNEPFVSAMLGYQIGVHAPGHTSMSEGVAAAHHILLAHGMAVPLIRKNVPDAQVGIVTNHGPKMPASSSFADKKAAVYADGYLNRWYLDPLAGRGYPQDMVDAFGGRMDFVQDGDLDVIATPIDYLGINYYTREIVRSKEISESENEPPTIIQGDEITEMDWEVYPDGLYDFLGRLHFEYGYSFPAIYVTENGAAFPDTVSPDGQVHDPARLTYIKRHLEACHRSIQIGVPLKGYFAWSLFDNFEWSFGYRPHFGIVHVDFETQKRTPKSSALWYSDVIKRHGINIEEGNH